ncbi:helix-turn-helix domain-containing protein [Shouchella clausii]|uniref:helix-turn-helix domain-containing protein n=1 Tax=Shouchella clausii TaxID=79880 RepID=UPI003461A581
MLGDLQGWVISLYNFLFFLSQPFTEVKVKMISYEPLFNTLKERNMKLKDLYKVCGKSTCAKFSKGESVRLDTIQSLCNFLNVDSNQIVIITPD